MRKNFRIIIAALSVSIILMGVLSFYSIDRFTSLTNYSYWLDHSNKVIQQLYASELIIKDIDRIERGYMITKDTSYQRQLSADIDRIPPIIDSLKNLTTDNETEKQNVILIRSSLALRLNYVGDNFAYLDTTHSSEISHYYNLGKKAAQDCISTIRVMQNNEAILIAERQKNKDFYQRLTSTSLKFILAAFFIITICSFILIIKEFRKRIAYQEELQAKVFDLKHSHAELEQIAYAASHDLQEPLRKIQVFTNRLVWLKNEDIDEDSKHTMERISHAATRMQELIEDLANVTSLSNQQHQKEQVDINMVLKQTIADLDEKIEEKKASITFHNMPVINGHPGQIRILFKALLDNALKFTREGVAPIINISAETIATNSMFETPSKHARKKYYRIDITDNGIGFDNKFSHKLFQMFQRLHNQHSEYHGKGIGLSMCQRVMANHNGFMEATGHPKTGATFKLFFPVEE